MFLGIQRSGAGPREIICNWFRHIFVVLCAIRFSENVFKKLIVLYFPASGPLLGPWPPALALNLQLPALAPNLYLPALIPNLCLPQIRIYRLNPA